MTRTSPGLTNWLTILSLGIIWGVSFMGVKIALSDFGPLTITALRIALGAVLLTAITYAIGDRLPKFSTATERRIWLHIIAMGFFANSLPFALLSWGQQHVTSGFAGICMAVVPLLVLPLAHFLIPGEQLSARKLFGFGLGFVGVVILIGPKALIANGGSLETLARIACIGSAFSYALGMIITRLSPPVSRIAYSAGSLIAASVMSIPLAMMNETFPAAPSLSSILAVLYVGIFPTALATLLMVRVITSAGPTFLTLTNYQVPIWSVVVGFVFLGELLPTQFLGALAIILFGLAISQTRLFARRAT